MRRPVAAAVAALLVVFMSLALVGCGGGAEETATTDAAAPAAAPPPAAPVAGSVVVSTTPSEVVFVPFPVAKNNPKNVQSRLDESRPMIVFFYDGSQKVSADIRKQIDAALSSSDDAADLVAFDLGEYTDVIENGAINVDAESLKDDPEAQAAVDLAVRLNIKMTPSLVISDDQNYVIFRTIGFIDSALLSRQLERVSQ